MPERVWPRGADNAMPAYELKCLPCDPNYDWGRRLLTKEPTLGHRHTYVRTCHNSPYPLLLPAELFCTAELILSRRLVVTVDEVVAGNDVEKIEDGKDGDDEHVDDDHELPEQHQAGVGLENADQQEEMQDEQHTEVEGVSEKEDQLQSVLQSDDPSSTVRTSERKARGRP